MNLPEPKTSNSNTKQVFGYKSIELKRMSEILPYLQWHLRSLYRYILNIAYIKCGEGIFIRSSYRNKKKPEGDADSDA